MKYSMPCVPLQYFYCVLHYFFQILSHFPIKFQQCCAVLCWASHSEMIHLTNDNTIYLLYINLFCIEYELLCYFVSVFFNTISLVDKICNFCFKIHTDLLSFLMDDFLYGILVWILQLKRKLPQELRLQHLLI